MFLFSGPFPLKDWLFILKCSPQSTGQNMTISKQLVQCPYPGVCKKLLQALSEAVKDIASLEAVTCFQGGWLMTLSMKFCETVSFYTCGRP